MLAKISLYAVASSLFAVAYVCARAIVNCINQIARPRFSRCTAQCLFGCCVCVQQKKTITEKSTTIWLERWWKIAKSQIVDCVKFFSLPNENVSNCRFRCFFSAINARQRAVCVYVLRSACIYRKLFQMDLACSSTLLIVFPMHRNGQCNFHHRCISFGLCLCVCVCVPFFIVRPVMQKLQHFRMCQSISVVLTNRNTRSLITFM